MNSNDIFNFQTALKVIPQQGNLVYEYNPFYNYRLNKDMIFYNNKMWDIEEFAQEFSLQYEDGVFKKNGVTVTQWKDIIPPTVTPPIVYQKGQLSNFETDELKFSLKNPVNILPQYSYDDSVNLILNDGINPPRLINSRFSVTERNKYQVCNRKGNNDSNIYDQGEQFDTDTSLYKKITTIPELQFKGVGYGGNLKIGNYHFYFRYVDEDGNFSDFFAESGLVSIFIGNTADSIYSGFRNENSHKLVKFTLYNTDPGYTKVVIYYTKATSDINQNAITSAFMIDRKFTLNESGNTMLTISGFEDVTEVDISEINPMYQIYGSVETQAQAQNILFLGNVDKPKLPYEDLADCALRFLPYLDVSEEYNLSQIKDDYTGNVSNTYYDTNYIYNKVGYHNDEIYRFGIVYILPDNTLSEVYNVRGAYKINESFNEYSNIEFINQETKERVYINFDEQYYNIITTDSEQNKTLENAKGVVSIDNYKLNTVIGINFAVSKEVIDYLYNTLKIKGYFFVRQKRIPTTICQAYTIGIDKESNTPVIPYEDKYVTESFLTKYNKLGDDEQEESRLLDNDIKKRKYTLEPVEVRTQGAICPEYDVNSPYLNSLFTGTNFICKKVQKLELDNINDIHYITKSKVESYNNESKNIKVIGVEDNTKLIAINEDMFSARAGEAEEAFRYEYIGKKTKNTEADNLLRGSYGPYLGIVGYDSSNDLIDIKIPGYSESNMQEYFEIRYHDKSPFYAISYRYDLSKKLKWIKEEGDYYTLKNSLYRGDCYICQFTHRLNRNFQDPSMPINSQIVDSKSWKENYKVSDGIVDITKFDKINLGDVNAVALGLYITIFVRSTFNLNIRAIDESYIGELSLFGHPRGFYPYFPMSNGGVYKIPEALCYNKGFEKSLSEKFNFEIADVPWIKNEFSNRIAYSNIQIKDAFSNGWRTFLGTHYRDYPKTYGSITKIIELQGNLLCVFEHGISLIPINERAIAGEGAGGNVYINTSNVLPENPKVISDIFGSQWKESIIKTRTGVYGVDTVAKKIWKTDGSNFECISDFKVQEFLNNNISLTERELEPVIGIRNIKAHYNKFKGDIMFTFYDNLYGFEEKVWNLCWNELSSKWITFYSWVPSYSENIYNQYFSFDRTTSKLISKLGISRSNNDFSDGIVLSENIIPNNYTKGSEIGVFDLHNRTLPKGEGVSIFIYYTLDRDNLGNFNYFDIKYKKYQIVDNKKSYIGDYVTLEKMLQDSDKNYDSILVLKTDAINLCSELYVRGEKNKPIITNPESQKEDWINNILNDNYTICKDELGRRMYLDEGFNTDRLATLLNVRANVIVNYSNESPTLAESYITKYSNGVNMDAGYYQSIIAVIPKYNMQFLTTDFWKHGKSGIIDISDKIYPTYWYGKQHPFEFEFIVADKPHLHKLFDNLQIISNNVSPESFHYEIIGDCYDFSKDKKNMYIRQEATKELYQYNGVNITYDKDYIKLQEQQRQLDNGYFDKSTLLPLYYSRQDKFNEVEDYYHLKDNIQTKDFSALSGGEIIRNNKLDEYRIWNHAKAIDLNDKGRLRGNMHYKEDQWYVQINPLNIVQKNEIKWLNDKIPIELGQSPLPNELLDKETLTENDIPKNSKNRDIVFWNWEDSRMREVKIKDKYIKIRIRYKGDKLALISAIITLYSISYS